MKYLILITENSAPFIATYFNDGVEPLVIEGERTVFVFSADPDVPNTIVSEAEIEAMDPSPMMLLGVFFFTE